MIRSPAALVFLLTVAAAVCGFVRELATAAVYGTSASADAFALLLLYADGVYAVMTFGIASQVLVPLFVRLRQDAARSEWHVLSGLMVWIACLGTPLALAGALAPDAVTALLVPDFSPAQTAAMAAFSAVLVPTCMLLAAGSLVGGALRAESDFVVPVIGRGVLSAVTAIGLLAFGWAWGPTAGALSVLFGALAMCGLLLWRLRACGWHWVQPRLFDGELRAMMRSVWPILAASLITFVLIGAVQRGLASDLPTGAFAITNYAQRLLSLAAMLTMAVATVAATDLARHFHDDGISGLRTRMLHHLRTLTFLLVPATVLLVVLSGALVTISFQRGDYTPAAAADTALALRYFALALLPNGVVAVTQLVFTSAGHPRRVAATAIVMAAVTLPATVALKSALGAMVLAAAFSLGTITYGVACLLLTGPIVGWPAVIEFGRYLAAVVVRSAAAVLAAAGLLWLWRGPDAVAAWASGSAPAVASVLAAVVFAVVFLALSRWSRDDGFVRLSKSVIDSVQGLRQLLPIP